MKIEHRPRTRKTQSVFEPTNVLDASILNSQISGGRTIAWTGLKPELPSIGTKLKLENETVEVVAFEAMKSDDAGDTAGYAWLHVKVQDKAGKYHTEPPSFVGL